MEFKDWAFVEIGPRGEVIRHGHVIDRVTEGVFLVQIYANEQTHAEPVTAEQMMSWKLFPDQKEMQRYMVAMTKQSETPADPDEPPETPADPDEPTTLPTVTKHGNESTAEDDKE